MTRTLEQAEADLARERFIRQLTTRGFNSAAAEHVASKASIGGTLIILGEQRALIGDPASMERMFAHVHENFPTDMPAPGAAPYDPVAEGKRMAAEQKKQNESSERAFR